MLRWYAASDTEPSVYNWISNVNLALLDIYPALSFGHGRLEQKSRAGERCLGIRAIIGAHSFFYAALALCVVRHWQSLNDCFIGVGCMSSESEQPSTFSRQGLRRLPRNVWVLTLVSFFTDISSEMIVHLIPLFLANVLGVRTITIGFIEGVAETTASLVKIISGRYSDRLGSRKWLTVAGYGLSTAAKPFLALANSWQAVFAVRFTERIGKGIRTAPRDALIADSIPAEKRGLAFGVQRAGDTAGATLGILAPMVVVLSLIHI